MRYTERIDPSNRFFVATLVVGLLGIGLLTLFAANAFAFTLLGDREIRMGSSQPGDVNDYTVEFDVATSGDLGGVVVTFCANSPIIGDPECEAPDNFDLMTSLANLNAGDVDFTGFYADTSQHTSAGTSGDNTVAVVSGGTVPDTGSWSELDSVISGNNVRTDHLLESSSGDLFWSFGSEDNRAYIYRSTDGGTTWTQVESIFTGDGVLTDHLLESSSGDLFWSFGSAASFLAGGRAYIYRSTDGGATWTEMERVSVGNLQTDHLLESSSGDLFWSFGSSFSNIAYLYRSTDGGATWSEIESYDTGAGVWTDHLLESTSGNLFWSFGSSDNNAYLYRSTNGGSNWSEIERVTTGERVNTDYLLESSSGDLLWSFGSWDNNAYLYRSTDGGSSWAEVENVTTGNNINDDHLLESSTGNLFWSFASRDTNAYLYRSTDGGSNWSQVESISTGSFVYADHLLESSSGDLFWSFGSNDTNAYLYRSTDGGATWAQIESVITGNRINTDHLLESSSGDLFWSFGSSDNGAYLYGPNQIVVDPISTSASDNVLFDLVNVTNQDVQGTFYARIYTYEDPAHALGYTLADPWAGGDVVDAGGVALATAETIDITFQVPERLTFCIFTNELSGPGDFATCDGTTSNPISLGNELGVLSPDEPSISKDAKYNIATNAPFGATVRMRGDTLNAGSFSIDPAGDSSPGDGVAVSSSTGAEQFGLCTYEHPSSVDSGITPQAPYDHVDCPGTIDGQATGNDNNALFAFDQAAIGSTYGHAIAQKDHGDWSTGVIVFLANITNFTEPGIYTTTFDVIATGQY